MRMRTAAKRALQVFIAAGLAVIAGEVAVLVYPPSVFWALWLGGRSRICRAADAYRGMEQQNRFHAVQARFEERSRRQAEDGEYELWDTPAGSCWVPKGSGAHVPRLAAQQQAGIYGEGVRPGDVVFDCGAHVGLYVRKALAAGARLVVAIEPAQDNLACLRRNLSAEIAAGRATVVEKGVWDRDDRLVFYEEPSNSAADNFLTHSPRAKVIGSVPVTTIDAIAAQIGLKVDFIKMDIKGATLRALQGAAATLRRDRPRLAISTEEEEDDPLAISRHLAAAGYQGRCGLCSVNTRRQVQPDVMLFE